MSEKVYRVRYMVHIGTECVQWMYTDLMDIGTAQNVEKFLKDSHEHTEVILDHNALHAYHAHGRDLNSPQEEHEDE